VVIGQFLIWQIFGNRVFGTRSSFLVAMGTFRLEKSNEEEFKRVSLELPWKEGKLSFGDADYSIDGRIFGSIIFF